MAKAFGAPPQTNYRHGPGWIDSYPTTGFVPATRQGSKRLSNPDYMAQLHSYSRASSRNVPRRPQVCSELAWSAEISAIFISSFEIFAQHPHRVEQRLPRAQIIKLPATMELSPEV